MIQQVAPQRRHGELVGLRASADKMRQEAVAPRLVVTVELAICCDQNQLVLVAGQLLWVEVVRQVGGGEGIGVARRVPVKGDAATEWAVIEEGDNTAPLLQS